jgi:hypothetical protein
MLSKNTLMRAGQRGMRGGRDADGSGEEAAEGCSVTLREVDEGAAGERAAELVGSKGVWTEVGGVAEEEFGVSPTGALTGSDCNDNRDELADEFEISAADDGNDAAEGSCCSVSAKPGPAAAASASEEDIERSRCGQKQGGVVVALRRQTVRFFTNFVQPTGLNGEYCAKNMAAS